MIPPEIRRYPLIFVEKNQKSPKTSPEDHKTVQQIEPWYKANGNYGVCATESNDLVICDSDSEEFSKLLEEFLPETFVVRSGGGGKHYYFSCDRLEANRKWADPEGSIRSNNWYVVGPGSVHPSGSQYQVLENREIASVSIKTFERLIRKLDGESANTAGGAAAAGCVGSSSLPSIPSEYPNQEVEWSTMKSWLSENGFLGSFDRTTNSDWSAFEFKIAKCLAEGGFSEESISEALDRLHHNSKWNRRGSDYQTRTVRKAIQSAVDDSYIDFSDTGDMDLDKSESRKTEESGEGRTLRGGENDMADFNDKLSVPVLEASEEGDSFKKITLVEGNDNGDTFEFLSLKKGQVQEASTTDGETVLVENVQDSVSLGSPEYLEDLITGLEAMKEELE